jgi:hypothetical protein
MPRIHFPNFPLRLVLPVDRAAAATAGVKELVFRTLPSVNKARTHSRRNCARPALRAALPLQSCCALGLTCAAAVAVADRD